MTRLETRQRASPILCERDLKQRQTGGSGRCLGAEDGELWSEVTQAPAPRDSQGRGPLGRERDRRPCRCHHPCVYYLPCPPISQRPYVFASPACTCNTCWRTSLELLCPQKQTAVSAWELMSLHSHCHDSVCQEEKTKAQLLDLMSGQTAV